MVDRNKIIDECINKIKEMVKPHCNDHTPYRGDCVSCGDTRNWDELPDPEDVIESLEELKTKEVLIKNENTKINSTTRRKS